jgi:hypothetical protein
MVRSLSVRRLFLQVHERAERQTRWILLQRAEKLGGQVGTGYGVHLLRSFRSTFAGVPVQHVHLLPPRPQNKTHERPILRSRSEHGLSLVLIMKCRINCR